MERTQCTRIVARLQNISWFGSMAHWRMDRAARQQMLWIWHTANSNKEAHIGESISSALSTWLLLSTLLDSVVGNWQPCQTHNQTTGTKFRNDNKTIWKKNPPSEICAVKESGEYIIHMAWHNGAQIIIVPMGTNDILLRHLYLMFNAHWMGQRHQQQQQHSSSGKSDRLPRTVRFKYATVHSVLCFSVSLSLSLTRLVPSLSHWPLVHYFELNFY